MRTQLRRRSIALVERSDRHPALTPQPRRLGGIGVERHEQPPPLADADAGIDDRIDVEREADRRLLGAVMDDRVAAAAPDLAAHAGGEDREAEPALIFEAVPFGR